MYGLQHVLCAKNVCKYHGERCSVIELWLWCLFWMALMWNTQLLQRIAILNHLAGQGQLALFKYLFCSCVKVSANFHDCSSYNCCVRDYTEMCKWCMQRYLNWVAISMSGSARKRLQPWGMSIVHVVHGICTQKQTHLDVYLLSISLKKDTVNSKWDMLPRMTTVCYQAGSMRSSISNHTKEKSQRSNCKGVELGFISAHLQRISSTPRAAQKQTQTQMHNWRKSHTSCAQEQQGAELEVWEACSRVFKHTAHMPVTHFMYTKLETMIMHTDAVTLN